MFLAGLCSGIIGWERERHGREAGLRTTILVGLGTAAIMITSLRIHEIFLGQADPRISIDPARIAYGVVTGIGFLGAGAIVKDAQRVRGLTTAACLWAAMAISLTVGCGHYLLSLLTTGLSLITLNLLKLVERKIPRDEYHYLRVSLAEAQTEFATLRQFLLKENFTILSVGVTREVSEKKTTYRVTLRHRGPYDRHEIVDRLASYPGVVMVDWH